MFEITKNHQDAYEYYINERMAYPGGDYDFTFEDRFLIYHSPLRHQTVYIAIDMKTGLSVEICSRKDGVYMEHEYTELIPDIFNAIKYTGDRRYKNVFAADPLKVIDSIFRIVLPSFGYTVREEQIKLCKQMFLGMKGKRVSICEAEVGTGKTLAYLIAGLCAKRYENSMFGGDNPVTITTSNIELQTALVERELPKLSQMLMEYHIINRPLTAVLRKGKEHYFCLFRYRDFIGKLSDYPDKNKEFLENLEYTRFDQKAFDLDKLKLKGSIKSKICVKGSCRACPCSSECKYIEFISRAKSANMPLDFQVTNHNLYLNSIEQEGLLRHSSYIIIDEAHKLKEAAQDVYGKRIYENDVIKYINFVKNLYDPETDLDTYKRLRRKVALHNTQLFKTLKNKIHANDIDSDVGSIINLDYNTIAIIKKLSEEIAVLDTLTKKCKGKCEISAKQIIKTLERFTNPAKICVWIDQDENGLVSLCCCSKNIGGKLQKGVWDLKSSHVLTSGTMSDGSSFDFFRRENGLDRIRRDEIIEMSTPSPFDYKNNTRLFIPNDMPTPDNDSEEYINAVADKVVQLVNATNGHTAILFTSYKVLNAVYIKTKERLAKYDIICMTRSNKTAITDFKKSKNGVLFASGSMWEGVDCVGDCLSSVIIVRLPFPIRSAAMEEKKEACENVPKFIREYAVPEMLIKLRQGAGRLIRSETDTGLLSILDPRANSGSYAVKVAQALSKYPKVQSIEEAKEFMKSVKEPEYFE